MSRTLTGGMTGHLAGRSHTRCNMLLIDLRDGTSIGITDHNRDLAFDLGDGEVTYSAKTGILSSDVSLQTGLEADNYEVTGPIGETISQEQLLGGRLDRARVRLFQVNWRDLSAGSIKLMAGNVTDARAEGGRFILEIRNDFDRYNQTVGNIITNHCNADYGDARCGATPETITFTVTTVTDAMVFGGTYTGDYADGYFDVGTVTALTGELVGTKPVEIFRWDQAAAGAAQITLFQPMVEAPAVGDTFTVKRGCPRVLSACKVRGAGGSSNAANFRGYPFLPGSDQVLRPTVPGQGNDG